MSQRGPGLRNPSHLLTARVLRSVPPPDSSCPVSCPTSCTTPAPCPVPPPDSPCPVFCPCRSLDRKLQRPLLGKSRTLPGIPQSPVLSRLPLLEPAAYRDEMPEQKPYKKHSASEHQKGCTVPSAGECRGEHPPLCVYRIPAKLSCFSRGTDPTLASVGFILLSKQPFLRNFWGFCPG